MSAAWAARPPESVRPVFPWTRALRKKKKGGSRSQFAQKHATDHPLFIRLDMDAILQETSAIDTSASHSYGTPNVRNATVVFAAPLDGLRRTYCAPGRKWSILGHHAGMIRAAKEAETGLGHVFSHA